MQKKIIGAGLSGILAFLPLFEAASPALAQEAVSHNVDTSDVSLSSVFTQLQNQSIVAGMSEEMRQHAMDFLERYGKSVGCDPQSHDASCAQVALPPSVTKTLKTMVQTTVGASPKGKGGSSIQSQDVGIQMAHLFDGMAPAAKWAYDKDVNTEQISSEGDTRVFRIEQMSLGKTLGYQKVTDLGYQSFLVTMEKDDPQNPGKRYVDVVFVDIKKGAAHDKKLLYSRAFQRMLENLKKIYYDQCAVVRLINNGENPPRIPNTDCANPLGSKREGLSRADIQKLYEKYKKNQAEFAAASFKDAHGQTVTFLEYLQDLETISNNGGLENQSVLQNMNWRTLDAARQAVMAFEIKKKTRQTQKALLGILTQEVSQLTGTQLSNKQSGALGLGSHTPEELQKTLTDLNEGKLAHHWVKSKVNERSGKFVPPAVLAASSNAMLAMAYAETSRKRAGKMGLSKEEKNEALSLSDHWLQIAQNNIRILQLENLSEQVGQLKNGEFQTYLGLTSVAAKQEAKRLEKVAKEYEKEMREISDKEEAAALQKDASNLYFNLLNASLAELYGSQLKKKMEKSQAEVEDLRALYLAREFAKVEDHYQAKNSLSEIKGQTYQDFLAHLSPEQKKVSDDLLAFSSKLKAAGDLPDDGSIRARAAALLRDRFPNLLSELGLQKVLDKKEIKEKSLKLSIFNSQILAGFQNFTGRIQAFTELNELDEILRENASSKPSLAHPKGFWQKLQYLGSLRFLNTGANKAELGQRDRATGILLAHNWLTKEAYQKLMANEPLRDRVLYLMNQGNYSEAFKKIGALDPEMAATTLKNYTADQLLKDPAANLSFEGFMTEIPEDSAGTEAQGVMGDLFSHVKTLILGYQLASAAVDAAAFSAYSTFIGGAAIGAERLTQFVIDSGQALRAAEAADDASALGRLSQSLDSLGRVGAWTKKVLGGTVEFFGRTAHGWATGTKNALGLAEIGSKGESLSPLQTVVQIGRKSVVNSLKMQGTNALIMGGASGVMSAGSYWLNPQTSQYETAGEAFKEGAVYGAAFGARATPLMMASPIQAPAFGVLGNRFSSFVKSVADTPGPLSWTIQSAAKLKLIPRVSESVAESGPLGALQMYAQTAPSLLRPLYRVAIWAGGMADGMAKYFFTGLGAQILVEQADYGYHSKMGDYKDNPETGKTARDQNIANSFQAGQAANQVSWLFLPTTAMRKSEDIADQQEEQAGFANLMAEGRSKEIEALPDDYTLTYKKSFSDSVGILSPRAWKERAQWAWDSWVKKRPPMGVFKVTSQWREEAMRKRLDSFSDSELALLLNADKKDNNQFFKFTRAPSASLSLGKIDENAVLGGAGKTEEAGPKTLSQEEIETLAKNSDFRLSDSIVDVARKILNQRLMKSSSLRVQVLDAGDSLTLASKDGTSAVVSGPELEKLKSMAAIAQINSSGTLKFLRKNFWNASLHLGRDVYAPQDILVEGLAQSAGKNGASESWWEKAGQEKAASALEEMKASGDESRASAIDEEIKKNGLNLNGSLGDLVDAANEKIASLEKDGNNTRAQALETAKNHLIQTASDAAADELIDSIHKTMDEKISSLSSAGHVKTAEALRVMRKTLESDAYTQAVDRQLAENFKAYQKGKISQTRMDLSVNLVKSVWERGVFGQRFGEWKTLPDGTRELEVPQDRQLRDARGNPIKSFRELQARQILATLKELSKGENRIFNLLKTSGGKTLLSFVMLDFLDYYARSRGKLGAAYLTTNPDLASQTMDQYLATFSGRKPRFKIKTYSDFWAELAQADKFGGSNPLELYDMVLDEYDMMAMTTALSLGSFNGIVGRYPELDPVQTSLREGAEKLQELFKKYDPKKELDPATFKELLKNNPEFKEDFEDLVAAQTRDFRKAVDYTNSKAYRAQLLDPHSPLYEKLGLKSLADFKARYKMDPEQVYFDMLKSHQHAFGGGLFDAVAKKTGLGWGGVIGRQYGTPKKWIEKIYGGGFQALSKKNLQDLFATNVDKNKQEVIQYFNGVPLDNLDTEYRSYLEALYGKPLTLDFDSLAVVDFAKFNNKAKAAGTVMLGLSGTLAHSIRPFMQDKMGFKVIGDESAGYQVDYQILKPEAGNNAQNAAQDFILKDMLEKKPNLSIIYADTKAEYESLRKSLRMNEIPNDEIVVGITPDTNFQKENRRQTGVEEYKNLAALKDGKAKVLILVGQAGFRGLDLPFGEAYKNGKFRMYVSNPENLATVNFKQLMGRIDSGRIPKGVKVNVTGVVDGKILEDSPSYLKVAWDNLHEISEKPQEKEAEIWNQITELVKESAEDPEAPVTYKSVKRLTLDPKALENPDIVAARDLLKRYRTLKKLSHVVTPEKAKELLDAKNAKAADTFLKTPKVADLLLGELMEKMQDAAELKAIEASGINRPPMPGIFSRIGAALKQKKP